MHFQTFIKTTEYVSPENIDSIKVIVEHGAFSNVFVNNKSTELDKIYNDLNKMDGYMVYKKEDVPEALHFKKHRLISDIVMHSNGTTDTGNDNDYPGLYLPPANGTEDQLEQQKGGQHGYLDISEGYDKEGSYPEMRGIFWAIGPSFKKGYRQPWIKLVDEYQVVC